MGRPCKGGGQLMAAANIRIEDISYSRNPVAAEEKFIISVSLKPEKIHIMTSDGYIITDTEGNHIVYEEKL